jgi:selenocysteine lyase/cysteine desulfurase
MFNANAVPAVLPGMTDLFDELKSVTRAAAETYSNVHRGSGHFSQVTTHLFELARKNILEGLGLSASEYLVLLCTPRQAELLTLNLPEGTHQCLSSDTLGLALGLRALVVHRRALPNIDQHDTGGGTARLVAPGWVVWAKGSQRYEAGTPPIINAIVFVRMWQLLQKRSVATFTSTPVQPLTVEDILYNDELSHLSGLDLLEQLSREHLGHDCPVPTLAGTRAFINFDNAASTPTFEPVLRAFEETLRQPKPVQEAIVHEVRSVCARVLGAPSSDYECLFTANTTEGINLVAQSLTQNNADGSNPVVVNTLLEHNSNELPWRTVAHHSLIRLAVDDEGFVDPRELESALQSYNERHEHGNERICLIAVSAASNVLGTFNDVKQICSIAHRYGARVLVDAAQLVGHRGVRVDETGADYLVFSAHKMYAPFGSGALIARKRLLHFKPEVLERIRRSGDENAAGIAAMGKAFILLQRIGMDVVHAQEQSLTAYALEQLARIPKLRIFGIRSPAAPRFDRRGGVIAFDLRTMMPHRLATALSEQRGIGVRYGCHCSHLLVKRLHRLPRFLERVQWLIVKLFPKLELPGLLRVSFGIQNTKAQVDELIGALADICQGSKQPNRPRLTDGATRREFQAQMVEFKEVATRRVYC